MAAVFLFWARTVRYNYDRIDAYINGGEEGQAYKDNVMVYPNGLIMGKAIKIGKRETSVSSLAYTKHYYIGSERICAKTGSFEYFGGYPQDILDNAGKMQALTASTVQTPTNTTMGTATTEVLSVANNMGAQVTVPNPDPITNITYTTHNQSMLDIYYFHPDHLGSSSYVTNSAGVVSQHMEYLPFGETLVDEHLNSNNSPFKYNGKEFDEETGNYYYSARYYDPKWSIFISVDPLAEETMDAFGYCYQNPINLTDPTGMSTEGTEDFYRLHGSDEVVWLDREDEIEGYEHLGKEYNVGSDMPEMIIGDTPSNYAWCNFTDDVKGFGRRADRWAESWGKDMGMFIASMHTGVAVQNAYKAHTEGTDITGEAMSKGEANFQVAMSVLPIPKLGKFGGALERTVSKTGTTVLGHYPQYVKLAESLGAKRFQIPPNVWNKMSTAEQWIANTKFLDRMILRGDNIRLATPFNKVRAGSFFEKELDYLFERGYKLSPDGLWLIK